MHPHGKGAYKVCDPGLLRRLPGIVHTQPRRGDRDIGKNITGKELTVLKHDANISAQGALVDPPEIDTVIGDHALLGRQEAQQQLHERGLAAAGFSHHGDIFPGLYGQVQIAQDRRTVLRVAEGDVVQLDLAVQRGNRLLPAALLRRLTEDRLTHFQNRPHIGKAASAQSQRIDAGHHESKGRGKHGVLRHRQAAAVRDDKGPQRSQQTDEGEKLRPYTGRELNQKACARLVPVHLQPFGIGHILAAGELDFLYAIDEVIDDAVVFRCARKHRAKPLTLLNDREGEQRQRRGQHGERRHDQC